MNDPEVIFYLIVFGPLGVFWFLLLLWYIFLSDEDDNLPFKMTHEQVGICTAALMAWPVTLILLTSIAIMLAPVFLIIHLKKFRLRLLNAFNRSRKT